MIRDESPPTRLDAGARGGLVGQAVVVAAFVALAAIYSTAPVLCGPLMLAAGAVTLVVSWRVAVRRRRVFSAVQWLMLSLLLLTLYAVLQSAPTDELRRFYDADPWRRRNVLIVAGVLASIALVSFAMLRRVPRRPSE